MLLDQLADAVGVVGFVSQGGGTGAEVVQQLIGDLPIMCLASGRTEPDREPLRVNDNVYLGREPAARSTETMIWTPFFAVAAW